MPKHQAMEACMETGGKAPRFLNLYIRSPVCERHPSSSGHFTYRKNIPVTHYTGDYVGLEPVTTGAG
jgi:hypothetical protein